MALTQFELKGQLHYDPQTGIFAWAVNKTRVRRGDVAGSIDTKGRRQIKVNGGTYFAHRLAFLYMIGRFPVAEVDHINRDFTDNRWCNLREATAKQNAANRVYRKRGNGLPTGVHLLPSGRYQAVIGHSGSVRHIGVFDTQELAQEAYAREVYRHRDVEFLPRDVAA